MPSLNELDAINLTAKNLHFTRLALLALDKLALEHEANVADYLKRITEALEVLDQTDKKVKVDDR